MVCIVYTLSISHQQFGEFNTLYKDLRKYLDRFYSYYRMSIEQFDYILAQIEHLIYKPNTNWWHSISAEEKLAICIRYLYFLNCYHLKALSMFTLLPYYHPLGNSIVQKWLSLKLSQMSLHKSLYKYLQICMIFDDNWWLLYQS